MKELKDRDVALLLKSALEFNANILAIATNFYGNIDTKRSNDQFRKSLREAEKSYTDRINKILGDNRFDDK